MDSVEDGEFCVALRSALLRDRTAHLFAGAGIVADSDPEAELAETELKLGALCPSSPGSCQSDERCIPVVNESLHCRIPKGNLKQPSADGLRIRPTTTSAVRGSRL